MPTLLAVPNLCEGRDRARIAALECAFSLEGVASLDRHSDADHSRTVLTLAGEAAALQRSLLAGAVAAIELIDMSTYAGLHPAIGALDVCPLVWLDAAGRDRALVAAADLARALAALEIPVFLYGELAASEERRERAYFRNGGLLELRRRMKSGALVPDQGPPFPHPTAGATLLTVRPPLAAFNVELDGADLEVARAIAAGLRESGGGLPGVRAIGLLLRNGRAQVSTNIHDPLATPLAVIVERVRELAKPLGAAPLEAELVGLVPAAALLAYPADVPIRGFDPARQTIERRVAAND